MRKHTNVALVYCWIDFDGYSLGPMIHDAIHQYHHRCDSRRWSMLADCVTMLLVYSQPSRTDKPPDTQNNKIKHWIEIINFHFVWQVFWTLQHLCWFNFSLSLNSLWSCMESFFLFNNTTRMQSKKMCSPLCSIHTIEMIYQLRVEILSRS